MIYLLFMDSKKRLSDFSDQQLARMTNAQIRELASKEYVCIKDLPDKSSEAEGLMSVIREIDAGTYINPFSSQETQDFTRSPVKSVRAARTITSVFEVLNWIVCIAFGCTLLVLAAASLSNSNVLEGIVVIALAVISPVVIYYCYKFLYVALELLADIADDVRRIRLRGE